MSETATVSHRYERTEAPGRDKQARLSALERYFLVDTPREPVFDRIVELAADFCDTPIAAFNLVGDGREWIKAEVGLGRDHWPFAPSICAHAVQAAGSFAVPDLNGDERFSRHPLVTGHGLRFYACVCLETDDGYALGTLCVADREPRPTGLLPRQARLLELLARQVMTELELRRSRASREAESEQRTRSLQLIAQELTEETASREAAQDLLLQAQKMEALGQVVSGVAHDINNVLAAVQGAFAILGKRVGDEQLRFVIEQGHRAGDRAGAIVRQMLSFARHEPVRPRVLRLQDVLPPLETMLCHAIGRRHRCSLMVAEDCQPVLADPHQLDVALLNLAINARDAMPTPGVLAIRAANDRDGRVRISVTDSGIGMSEHVLERAREPFFTTKGSAGTGLGLAQVHSFAATAGGLVEMRSTLAQGTTVSILLPPSAVELTDVTRVAVPSELQGNATILLVDDDDQVRAITAELLRDQGYQVREARNGPAALAYAALNPIDLLLTDIAMPGMEGPDLARHLRHDREDLPVLFASALAEALDPAAGLMLVKPFTPEELSLHVLEALGRLPAGSAKRLSGGPLEPPRLVRHLRDDRLRLAYERWAAIRGTRRLPSLDDFDVDGLALDEMMFCTVEPGTPEAKVRVDRLGEALERRLGRPLDGLPLAIGDEDLFGSMSGAYRRCQATLAPEYDWARFRMGGESIRIDRLVLPFAADSIRVSHLVGVILFTEPSEGARHVDNDSP
ncbi:hybrid sensor histidine kinase/response regulator [Sphingomonas ginkgonis]|uniref:histidine kinase n=1 Tax=Sphingomonas ginkgonis TaxID=2315330 RepID=A0A3R9Z4Y6_9SPHN|nr:response regulator [Sphingomonas ginkgonis]RST29867.1 hybrid sensor histidine kinase/response regulator [Sphingomonas ginkgonis]